MKQQYDFDKIVDRAGTFSVKWEVLPDGAPADALSLWIADMDFPCAEPIRQALHARVDRMIYGYTLYNNAETKAAVSGWFSRRFGWEIDEDSICYAPCVVTGIAVLLNVLTNEGDGIVIQNPVYHPFGIKIRENKRQVVDNPLRCENGVYTMDFDDLDAKLSRPDVKGLLLCSPHNPTGRVWTPDELRRVVEIAKRYDKWIISDEIHCDILRAGITHTPLLKLCPEYAHRIIACTSPSKTFNLAGLQLANIIIPNPEYHRLWTQFADGRFAIADTGVFGLTALLAAYNEGEDWLGQVNAYLDGNIAFAADYLRAHLPRARMAEAQGTYLLWVDLNGYGKSREELVRILTQECKIALNPGYLFGEQGEGYVRINAACPRTMLEECFARMAAVLEKR